MKIIKADQFLAGFIINNINFLELGAIALNRQPIQIVDYSANG